MEPSRIEHSLSIPLTVYRHLMELAAEYWSLSGSWSTRREGYLDDFLMNTIEYYLTIWEHGWPIRTNLLAFFEDCKTINVSFCVRSEAIEVGKVVADKASVSLDTLFLVAILESSLDSANEFPVSREAWSAPYPGAKRGPFYISEGIKAELETMADRLNVSINQLIKEFIQEGVEKYTEGKEAPKDASAKCS